MGVILQVVGVGGLLAVVVMVVDLKWLLLRRPTNVVGYCWWYRCIYVLVGGITAVVIARRLMLFVAVDGVVAIVSIFCGHYVVGVVVAYSPPSPPPSDTKRPLVFCVVFGVLSRLIVCLFVCPLPSPPLQDSTRRSKATMRGMREYMRRCDAILTVYPGDA